MIHHTDTKNIAVEECILSANYFHFILDTLFPSFYKFLIKGERKTKFFVKYRQENDCKEDCIKSSSFRKNMFRILFPNCDIEYFNDLNFKLFRNSERNRPLARLDHLFPAHLNAFRSRIIENLGINCNREDKIIFIGRRDSQKIGNKHGKRILENQYEIFDICKKFKESELIYFEDMSWKDQIKKSNESKIMIGMHGAGLTNSIFTQRGSSILEILPEGFSFERFRTINVLCGNKHYSIEGKSNSKAIIAKNSINWSKLETRYLIHANQTLNPEYFEKILAKIVK